MNYKNILVAINLYDEYEQVINSAIKFAKKNNANIKMVTCIDIKSEFMTLSSHFQKAQMESINLKLSSIKVKIKEDYDINISCENIGGNANSQIALYAAHNLYDLIIVGSHGRHGIDLLFGSTANSVLHRAKCDVLTIRIADDLSPTDDYKKILVATDLEPSSLAVADKAKSIANLYQSKMHVVNVHSDPSMLAGVHGVFPLDIKEDIQKNFENWLKNNNIDATIHIVGGNTAQQIIDTANNIQCDLIIVGSHERVAIGRLFLGSTANAVLHNAKNDILVVRV